MVLATESMLIRSRETESVVTSAVPAVAVHIPKHRHVVTEHGAILPAVVSPAVEAIISGQRKQIERIRLPRHIEVGSHIIPAALIS